MAKRSFADYLNELQEGISHFKHELDTLLNSATYSRYDNQTRMEKLTKLYIEFNEWLATMVKDNEPV